MIFLAHFLLLPSLFLSGCFGHKNAKAQEGGTSLPHTHDFSYRQCKTSHHMDRKKDELHTQCETSAMRLHFSAGIAVDLAVNSDYGASACSEGSDSTVPATQGATTNRPLERGSLATKGHLLFQPPLGWCLLKAAVKVEATASVRRLDRNRLRA